MKLSSRKKLLEDANFILEEINSNISNNKRVNEIDWELHKKRTEDPYYGSEISKFIEFLTIKRLREIEKKYRYDIPTGKYTEEDKKKEIDEILEYLKKYREHLLKAERISEDPQKQTELQKAIVNTPKVEGKFKSQLLSPMIKDPETGFWWNADLGVPSIHGPVTKGLPGYVKPRTQGDVEIREYMEYVFDAMQGGVQWDSSRSWVYNIFNKFIKSFWAAS